MKGKAANRVTDLPMPKLCFEHVPVPCSPSCVDNGPIDKGNWVAKDPENRVLVPVHAGIIPHAVEAGDVVCEGGHGWRRDILGGECDRVAIAEQQCSCLVTCCALVGVGGYWS